MLPVTTASTPAARPDIPERLVLRLPQRSIDFRVFRGSLFRAEFTFNATLPLEASLSCTPAGIVVTQGRTESADISSLLGVKNASLWFEWAVPKEAVFSTTYTFRITVKDRIDSVDLHTYTYIFTVSPREGEVPPAGAPAPATDTFERK
jgi:hypothetical protein